jgi:hypothetical protein
MTQAIRGRFLPIARIHRARETVLEQAARAQKVVVQQAEANLQAKREQLERALLYIKHLIAERAEKVATGADELTRFDVHMGAARAARDQAIKEVAAAEESLAQEQQKYREIMRKMLREHEFVEVAMSQHRTEQRKHAQKIEIAIEEAVADSMSRPMVSVSSL